VRGGAGGAPARAGLRPATTGQHGSDGDDCAGDRRGSCSTAVAGAAWRHNGGQRGGGQRGGGHGGGGQHDGAQNGGRQGRGGGGQHGTTVARAVKMENETVFPGRVVKSLYLRRL
jgi:hypothetical protein